MKRTLLPSAILLSISLLQAQELQSFRAQTGEVDPIGHLRAQLRGGYIGAQDGTGSAALGGHIHIDTRQWHGFGFGAAFYTVQNMGTGRGSVEFFDGNGESFTLLSEAFVRYSGHDLSIKAGRQMIDTPHADSDDIRMIPNYFSGITFSRTVAQRWRIEGGRIWKMAGWENGIDASEFIDIGTILGAKEATGGFWMAGLGYETEGEFSASLWLYRFDDIAKILYFDVATERAFGPTGLTAGVQWERALESGEGAAGAVDASTWGVMAEISFDTLQTDIQAAYNRSTGKSGAFGSLGGGPFYTSMEQLTIDALGESGRAWCAGGSFATGWEGLRAGIVHGAFRSDDPARFDATESDILLDYSHGSHVSLTAAYSFVNDRTERNLDVTQLRIIANYHF